MTLDKAIEIETIHNDHNPNYTDAEREQAHQLGIRALERILSYRRLHILTEAEPLPGETR